MGVDSSRVEQVKKVLIPKYFDEIVIPNMQGYYSDYTVDFYGHPVAKCPIHGEDTPSLRWYEETNTFFCFGCRRGGDVIHLHRLFTNTLNGNMPSFEEAVIFLESYFVNGTGEFLATNVQLEEVIQKSSTAEVILLSNYVKRLEEQLNRETNMRLDKKMEIYTAIDTATLLSSLNQINARDAMNYIKDVVKRAV